MINIFGNKWFSTFYTVSSSRFPKVKFLIKRIKTTLVSIYLIVSVAYARHCSKCLCVCVCVCLCVCVSALNCVQLFATPCVCVCVCVCVCTQLCPSLCDPMDCSLPGFSVHGILQARILEWEIPFPSPGDLPEPGIEPGSPALEADTLNSEPIPTPGDLPEINSFNCNNSVLQKHNTVNQLYNKNFAPIKII